MTLIGSLERLIGLEKKRQRKTKKKKHAKAKRRGTARKADGRFKKKK